MTDAKLMTIEEVSNLLRVRPSCIRRWVAERRIGFVKVGRLLRFERAEVMRIIEVGTRPAAIGRPHAR